MQVVTLSCLSDNYAYLLVEEGFTDAVVVDPSEAGPVLDALRARGLGLSHILATHHHFDHVGGIDALVAAFPKAQVLGHESEVAKGRIPHQSRGLAHGEGFDLFGTAWKALHIPAHTLGALGFVGAGSLFSGDTLFRAGCGRLFEGDAAMMFDSLHTRLADVDDATRLYPGHEYTVKNLRFGLSLVPGDEAMTEALGEAEAQRAKDLPTVGETMARERATNPFLRCGERALLEATGTTTPLACFAALRARRDTF